MFEETKVLNNKDNKAYIYLELTFC